MKPTLFSVPFAQTQLRGDMLGSLPSQVLCLHGAGLADRRRYDNLRRYLAKRKIGSTAFDMIGAGETGGELKSSSLKERTDQVKTVIETNLLTNPFTIIAGSMSGYTAIRLTEHFPISKLVLFVPAVYTVDAYKLQFNSGFTKRIRQPETRRESDAFQILSEFEGETLVIDAGQDKVIPSDLIDELMSAAQRPSRLTVTDSPHGVLLHLAAHPKEEQSVYATIGKFLQS